MNPSPAAEPVEVTWENLIPAEHWNTYACVLNKACEEDIPFALGGGLALGYYTGHLRRSKDLDIYVTPEDATELIRLMTSCGLEDYYGIASYDRNWIYRGHSDGVIVDAIWAMANRRTHVDERWTQSGPRIALCGQTFRVIPPEELIWSKLYVLQRDRCDWPDILNLIYATGAELDWDILLRRVGADWPLVKGILSVFSWLCPARAASIPRRVWERLELSIPRMEPQSEGHPSRKDLLDTRPWLISENGCQAA